MEEIFAQTVLTRSDLVQLKRKSGVYNTRGALHAAVIHYIKCHDDESEISS